jgi:hypothetical protein
MRGLNLHLEFTGVLDEALVLSLDQLGMDWKLKLDLMAGGSTITGFGSYIDYQTGRSAAFHSAG